MNPSCGHSELHISLNMERKVMSPDAIVFVGQCAQSLDCGPYPIAHNRQPQLNLHYYTVFHFITIKYIIYM